jgi:hypothetical protein
LLQLLMVLLLLLLLQLLVLVLVVSRRERQCGQSIGATKPVRRLRRVPRRDLHSAPVVKMGYRRQLQLFGLEVHDLKTASGIGRSAPRNSGR